MAVFGASGALEANHFRLVQTKMGAERIDKKGGFEPPFFVP